jgi:hypothetical protein
VEAPLLAVQETKTTVIKSGTLELCVPYKIRLAVIKGGAVCQTIVSRVEVGSNTSTVILRVVGGDKKGSLESETVNYAHESYGTRTRK